MSGSKGAESKGRRYSLILTGQRRRRRRRVVCKGNDRWLADEAFEALCELLYAKASGQDSVPLPRQVVRRIRQGLGEPAYVRGAASLVESGAKGTYFATPPCEEIGLDRSFLKQPAKDWPPRYRGRMMRRAFQVIALS